MADGKRGAATPKYLRHRPVREERIDEYVFLIDEAGQAIHTLDVIGHAIWTMLREPMGENEIVDLLDRAFPDAGRGKIRRDVAALFEDLRDADLVAAMSE